MRQHRDIYVVGDIHGDWIGFMDVLNQMFNDGYNPEKDLFVQLGDLVDGFPYSKEVVSWMIFMKDKYPDNVIVLRGNHEELMIHGVDEPRHSDQFQVWWQQGGQQTWQSYWGDEPLWSTEYVPISPMMHEHIEWFKNLPTLFSTNDYYFVHAGLEPEQPDPWGTSIYSRLWIRGPFLRSNRMWDKLVIHGHSPVKEPEVLPNRVNVNTRPRNKGYVSGAKLSNDGSSRVLTLYRSDTSEV